MLPAKIQSALNANLPNDIAIIDVEEVSLNFHAQYGAKSKTYRYTILNRNARCALQRNFYLLYPYTLNVRAMREESKSLIGRHDFKSFTVALEKMISQHGDERQNFLRLINTLQEKVFVLENQLNLLKAPQKSWYQVWK